MATVSVKWARNTAEALGRDADVFENVHVELDDRIQATFLTRDGDLVAQINQHDASSIVVQ